MYNDIIMSTLDDIHFSFRSIDGLDRDFNFVVSPREDGKTTAFFLTKAVPAFWSKNRPTILFRRYSADVTDAYIESLAGLINMFSDKKVRFKYNKGSKKEGVVDLFLGKDPMFRIIALNQPLERIKSFFLKNAAYCFLDEFICDMRHGEKYLPAEAFKMKEAFNTYQRFSDRLKFYAVGNPYSLYNPYFSEFGVDTKMFVPGCLLKGANWAAQRHVLNPELKKMILAKNPLYKFSDESYESYAVNGVAVNDSSIRIISKQPKGYSLESVFRIEGKTLGIFKSDIIESDPTYWAGFIPDLSSKRLAYCFDFGELSEGTLLFSADERLKFRHLRMAIRNRDIGYQNEAAEYSIEGIYQFI
jgi:hypothetical protein